MITDNSPASLIDHTLLKPDTVKADIIKLCQEAIKYNFKAVCINPTWVSLAAQLLSGSGTAVCTVIGFPLGAATTEIKAAEALQAVRDGADEIDMVINIGLFKDSNHDFFLKDVHEVVKSATGEKPHTIIKTIIETCLLNPQLIITASQLCEQAGVHFIKTSTGFSTAGATVEDIRLIKKSVSTDTGIKASGGIKNLDKLLEMHQAGATRIGTSSGVQIMEEYKKTLHQPL